MANLHQWQVSCCCDTPPACASSTLIVCVGACCTTTGTGPMVDGWTYEVRQGGVVRASGTLVRDPRAGCPYLIYADLSTSLAPVTVELWPPNAGWRKSDVLTFTPVCGSNFRNLVVHPAPGLYCSPCGCPVPNVLYLTGKYGTVRLQATTLSTCYEAIDGNWGLTCLEAYDANAVPDTYTLCPPPNGMSLKYTKSGGTVIVSYAVSCGPDPITGVLSLTVVKYSLGMFVNLTCPPTAGAGVLLAKRNPIDFYCSSSSFLPSGFAGGYALLQYQVKSLASVPFNWCGTPGVINTTVSIPAGTLNPYPGNPTAVSVPDMAETVTITS